MLDNQEVEFVLKPGDKIVSPHTGEQLFEVTNVEPMARVVAESGYGKHSLTITVAMIEDFVKRGVYKINH